MLPTISNHYGASEINIKVTLLSLFGVPSARAERSFTNQNCARFLYLHLHTSNLS